MRLLGSNNESYFRRMIAYSAHPWIRAVSWKWEGKHRAVFPGHLHDSGSSVSTVAGGLSEKVFTFISWGRFASLRRL